MSLKPFTPSNPAGLRGFCLLLLVVISLAYPRHIETDSKPHMTSYVTIQTDVNKVLENEDIHYARHDLHIYMTVITMMTMMMMKITMKMMTT